MPGTHRRIRVVRPRGRGDRRDPGAHRAPRGPGPTLSPRVSRVPARDSTAVSVRAALEPRGRRMPVRRDGPCRWAMSCPTCTTLDRLRFAPHARPPPRARFVSRYDGAVSNVPCRCNCTTPVQEIFAGSGTAQNAIELRAHVRAV